MEDHFVSRGLFVVLRGGGDSGGDEEERMGTKKLISGVHFCESVR